MKSEKFELKVRFEGFKVKFFVRIKIRMQARVPNFFGVFDSFFADALRE